MDFPRLIPGYFRESSVTEDVPTAQPEWSDHLRWAAAQRQDQESRDSGRVPPLKRWRKTGIVWYLFLVYIVSSNYNIVLGTNNCLVYIYIYIPHPLTLEYLGGGGKARNFWEIFHLTTWNIPPPHMFFGLRKDVGGGSSGCNIFSPEMVWHTLS